MSFLPPSFMGFDCLVALRASICFWRASLLSSACLSASALFCCSVSKKISNHCLDIQQLSSHLKIMSLEKNSKLASWHSLKRGPIISIIPSIGALCWSLKHGIDEMTSNWCYESLRFLERQPQKLMEATSYRSLRDIHKVLEQAWGIMQGGKGKAENAWRKIIKMMVKSPTRLFVPAEGRKKSHL